MFKFIKYIKPFWYFRLANKMPHAVLMNDSSLNQLLEEGILQIGKYRSEISQRLDLAYQALELGYIPDHNRRSDIQNFVIDDLGDNYRFIHRHFGKAKASYVLILRVFLFHNPIKEVFHYFRNSQERIEYPKLNKKNDLSDIQLVTDVKVSVIIPTLNRYQYLRDVLLDLQNQTYKNFDVWICDQSDNFMSQFYEGWNLDLHIIQQKEKALWYARNRCIESSNSDYLLFFDDDSRVEPEWIQNHIKTCLNYNCLISAGITNTISGGGNSIKSDYFHLSETLDTGNVLIHKTVFKNTGMFDTAFERMRMGDGEFGLRSFLSGFQVISNPLSPRLHLKVDTGGLRQMGAWDAIHNIGLFKPKPIPSALYFARKHFDKNTAFIYGLTQLPKAFIPYSKKNSKIQVKLLYYMVSLIFSPLLLINFMQSWSISSKMIQKYKNNLTNV